jgi:hypothetical protein
VHEAEAGQRAVAPHFHLLHTTQKCQTFTCCTQHT